MDNDWDDDEDFEESQDDFLYDLNEDKRDCFDSNLDDIPESGDEWAMIQWTLEALKKELRSGALSQTSYDSSKEGFLRGHYKSLCKLKESGDLPEDDFEKLCLERNLMNYVKKKKETSDLDSLTFQYFNKSLFNSLSENKNPEISESIKKLDKVVRNLEDLYFRHVKGSRPTENERDIFLGENVLVAFYDGEPAGAVWTNDVESRYWGLRTYIEAIFVVDRFRYKKIGSNLILNILTPEDVEAICLNPKQDAVEFYQKNGFFTYDTRTEGDDIIYEKMILPLTKDAFWNYNLIVGDKLETIERKIARNEADPEDVKRSREHFFAGLFFDDQTDDLTPNEWSNYVTASMKILEQSKDQDRLPLNEMPFTMFIYKKLGLEHKLLDSYSTHLVDR